MPRPDTLELILETLVSIDRRLAIFEQWVQEWETADILTELELQEQRDKTRDH